MPKSSEELEIILEFSKTSETLQTVFKELNFGKYLEIFGNFWKTLETVQNDFNFLVKSLKNFGNG